MTISKRSLVSVSTILASVAFASHAFASSGGSYTGYTPDLLPPNPSSGKCYARVEVPAQYSTTSEQVVVEEAVTRVDITQAVLAPRQEKVLIKEASTRFKVRQPSYKSVTERVMTRPAYDKLSVSPPQFKTITETVQTSAPRLVWKRGNPGRLRAQGYTIHSTADAGVGGRGYSSTTQFGQIGGTQCGDTCEIWCLVEAPGETTKYNRRVLASPGRVNRTTVPARYQTIHKQVVSDPGGVQEVPVPAQYRTITVEDLVTPGGETSTVIPPKYGDVAKKVLVSPSRYEWREVICKPGTGSIRSGYSSGATHASSTSHNVSSGSSHSSSSHSGHSYSGASAHSTRSHGTSGVHSTSGYTQSSPKVYGSSQPSVSYSNPSVNYSKPSVSYTTPSVTDPHSRTIGSGSYGSGYPKITSDNLQAYEDGRLRGPKRVKRDW